MPLYEYEVSGTGERFEVLHSIHGEVKTWGEVSLLLGTEIGHIRSDTPVSRVPGGRIFVNGNLADHSKGKVIQKDTPPKALSCCGGGCHH
jgi:hypothetical protein